MHIDVEGAPLFFDVVGAKLAIGDDGAYREKPVLVLVHGGPGYDHSVFRPFWDRFSDVAQVIYLDLNGHGRSGGDDPDRWNLASWGRDLKVFCDTLGLEAPIVGGVSFGGFVAMSYAAQFPDHPGRLILASTAARTDMGRKLAAFEALGGKAARDAAEAFWDAPTPERVQRYLDVCAPLYSPGDVDPHMGRRVIMRLDAFYHFVGRSREMMTFDLRAGLGGVRCPTLVLGGERDPMTPPDDSREVFACLPPGMGELALFPHCGHGVERADPDGAERVLRPFIAAAARRRPGPPIP